jgi:hypothetical protein
LNSPVLAVVCVTSLFLSSSRFSTPSFTETFQLRRAHSRLFMVSLFS